MSNLDGVTPFYEQIIKIRTKFREAMDLGLDGSKEMETLLINLLTEVERNRLSVLNRAEALHKEALLLEGQAKAFQSQSSFIWNALNSMISKYNQDLYYKERAEQQAAEALAAAKTEDSVDEVERLKRDLEDTLDKMKYLKTEDAELKAGMKIQDEDMNRRAKGELTPSLEAQEFQKKLENPTTSMNPVEEVKPVSTAKKKKK